jgi:uncharacterized protein (TIGR02284 family)
MTVETKLHLDKETRDTLAELLTLNIDSRDGFREASEKMDDVTVGSLCQTLAMQRQAQADELARLLEVNSQEPDRSGSFAAAAHRIWMGIREALSPDNTYALLAEAERGEDHIKSGYESALKKTAGSAVTDVLNHQYGQVKAAHDRVKMLRDEYAD